MGRLPRTSLMNKEGKGYHCTLQRKRRNIKRHRLRDRLFFEGVLLQSHTIVYQSHRIVPLPFLILSTLQLTHSHLHLNLPTSQFPNLSIKSPRLSSNLFQHVQHLTSTFIEVLLEENNIVGDCPTFYNHCCTTEIGSWETGEEL